jgi:hypothetical protein
MDPIDSLAVGFQDLVLVLAGIFIALVAGVIALLVISLLVQRPAEANDPDHPDHRGRSDYLEHVRIPGHSTEPVAVRPARAAPAGIDGED